MGNKYLRYIAGFILFAFILASFYYSKIFLLLASSFFIIITNMEYRSMLKTKEIFPHLFISEIVGIMCAYIFIYKDFPQDHIYITPILITGILLSFILTVITNRKPYFLTSMSTIASILFTVCGLYIIKLTYFFNHHYSWYLIIIYFTAVLAGDFAASQVGPRIKPIYIAPEISPNKTLAGSIANLIITCFICFFFHIFLKMPILYCLISGIIVSISSQFGDLTMSTIKRDIGIKHSGNLFYEYGGILDRMDSFLFSAPALYYFLCLIQMIK